MPCKSFLNSPFRSKTEITGFIAVLGLLLILLAACGEQAVVTNPTKPSPEVVATAWTAVIVGELLNVDGCIRIKDRANSVGYALVWTPDISTTVEGDEVRVVSGIVRGNQQEVVLHIGDTVRASGGETREPDEQLRKTLSPNCQEPYWVVGFEIATVQPTEKP